MYCEQIDLYDYFGKARNGAAGGYLKAYRHDYSEEYCIGRLRSAILVIPGGGYVSVSDREGESVALEYLVRGFDAFVLKYSVAPGSAYPTQLREAAMAMAYIRSNADKFKIDGASVAAIGFSAGGHLCGCLGTMFGSDVLNDVAEPSVIRPDAVILSYPVAVYSPDSKKCHVGSFEAVSAKDESLMEQLSLDRAVKSDSSPAFIWHTMDDACVPVHGSLVMAQKYYENNVPFEGHFFRSGVHGLSVCTDEVNSPNDNARPWVELSVAWLKSLGFRFYSR